MGLLNVIVLILIILVGYSAGIVLAARDREYKPAITDLLILILLWIGILWLRLQLNHWLLIGITLLVGLMVGGILAYVRLIDVDNSRIIPQSELPEHAREQIKVTASVNILKRIWRVWNVFGAKLGNVQARLLMGFFYFIVVSPFGLLVRLTSDPLTIKKLPINSGWVTKEPTGTTVTTAREQG